MREVYYFPHPSYIIYLKILIIFSFFNRIIRGQKTESSLNKLNRTLDGRLRRNVMVYSKNLAASIKVNGKVMREHNGVVYIPFGSEYSIFIKNLHVQRAIVSITIDGESIGDDLVINSNSSVNLERFIRGDKNKGYKFRFIEKTDDISQHRGDNVDDGVVRISYRFEKLRIYPTYPVIDDYWYKKRRRSDDWNRRIGDIRFGASSGNLSGSSNITMRGMVSHSVDNISLTNCSVQCQNFNDSGITAEGSDSNQSFVNTYVGDLETEEHVVCLMLRGENPETKNKITQPITVKTKVKCKYCGKNNKTTDKFCSKCSARVIVE